MTVQDAIYDGMPRQVMFYDGEDMAAGIMIGNNIVCACCGACFSVWEVVDSAREDGIDHAIAVFDTWVDISTECSCEGNYRDLIGSGVTVLKMEGVQNG